MRSWIVFVILWVWVIPAWASVDVSVGDRVRLKATHHDGVPVHPEPRGTNRFVRVPDGSEGVVEEQADEGHWLRLQLDSGVIGWITQRYVIRNLTAQPETPVPPPQPGPSPLPETQVWSSLDDCRQVVTSGGRMQPSNPQLLRLATWNIRWFPRGCSPSQSCSENATDVDWLACTIAWMGIDVLALEEMLDDPPARLQMGTLISELNRLTQGTWEIDLQQCGAASVQRVGFLWNSKRVTLSNQADEPQLNGAATRDDPAAACAGNLRPGRYARLTAFSRPKWTSIPRQTGH